MVRLKTRCWLSLCCLFFGSLAQAEVTVGGAWVREAPPVRDMTAGYLTLHNEGDAEAMLVGVTCPPYRRIEMHETVKVDGMARMQELIHAHIRAGQVFTFEPGGSHLMLMAPERPVRAGDVLDCTLRFYDGSEVEFRAPVKSRARPE